MSAVHEVCSCGATFDYTTADGIWSLSDCQRAVKQWREQHHHPAWPTKPGPRAVEDRFTSTEHDAALFEARRGQADDS